MATQAATIRTSIPARDIGFYQQFLRQRGYSNAQAFDTQRDQHVFLLFTDREEHRRYLQDRSEHLYWTRRI